MISKVLKVSVLVLSICGLVHAPAWAEESLIDAFKNGKTSVQLQFSLEYSDASDDGGLDAATGLTLRTRLGYRTGTFRGAQVFVQFHNLSQIMDNYRWPGGGDITRDVIADPDGSRIHQAYVDTRIGELGSLRLGRQEIILDDARLIGNVGWRQNGQSFDGAGFLSETDRNRLQLAYITRVNTILLTHVELDGLILVNNRFQAMEHLEVTGFGYLLDTESTSSDSRDSATYGVRMDGKAGRFSFDVTYALQTDYADGENHGGDMVNAFAGYSFQKWQIGGGLSRISGQNGSDRPFDTLFSTAHKFNGWSDQFLSTNGGGLENGLQDLYVQATTTIGKVHLLAVFHLYETTDDVSFGGDYGSEWNLLLRRSFNENLSGLIKAAVYRADGHPGNPTVDETVIWVRMNIRF